MMQQLTPEQALDALKAAALTHSFDKIGVLNVEHPHNALEVAGEYLNSWLDKEYNGSMSYMSRHGSKRWRPPELLSGTTRVIAVRMHYLPSEHQSLEVLQQPEKAYISRYALGRDYHKTLRQRLQKLSTWLAQHLAPQMQHSNSTDTTQKNPLLRVFVDSAPVMEKATAAASGLGWIGKHTLVLDKKAGSWFFLGEIYTNLPIAATIDTQIYRQQDSNVSNHCGRCTRCIEVCPTQAIVAPYTLDARRCISYLTIENKNAIPIEMRPAIGNRIFGCDDCQLFCPWNRFAKLTTELDFEPRHGLDQMSIIEGLEWTAEDFDHKTQGSPIRRTGYYGWLRNLAVAAGNAPASDELFIVLQKQYATLTQHKDKITDFKIQEKIIMVLEHFQWALSQQKTKDQNERLH